MSADEKMRSYEIRDRRKDGRTIDVEVHSNTITFGGGEATLTTLRDITERKRAEERVDRHLRMLQSTLKATWEATAYNSLVVNWPVL